MKHLVTKLVVVGVVALSGVLTQDALCQKGGPQLAWHGATGLQIDDLNGILFTSQMHGFVVGKGGTIRRSTDGGEFWESVTSNTKKNLSSIATLRSTKGNALLAFGDDGTVLKSIADDAANEGVTWTQVGSLTPGTSMVGVQVFQNLELIVSANITASQTGEVLRSNDMGATWEKHVVTGCTQLGRAEFADAMTGYAVGTTSTPGLGGIWRTTDGGSTWTEQYESLLGGITGVHVFDATHAIADGIGGLVVRTSNGTDWSSTVDPTDQDLVSVSFDAPQFGLATGDGFVFGSFDTGRSWRDLGYPGDRVVNQAVIIPGTNNVATAGNEGKIFIAVFKAGVATAQQASAQQLILSPNPSNGVRRLTMSGGDANTQSEPKLVTVTDELGREVYRQQGTKSTLDLPSLAAGSYHVNMQSLDGHSALHGTFIQD